MESQVVWFTGMSGAGKTTLCHSLAERLRRRSYQIQILDGDEMRKNLCAGLGFSTDDRIENVRRISYVATLIARSGTIVLIALISPLRSMRETARRTITESITHFCEVFVDAPLSVCEGRDVKGLYRRARDGEIPNFTGIGSPYEPPLCPEVICHTAVETVAESTDKVLEAVLTQRLPRHSGVLPQRNKRRTLAVDFDGVIADYDGWRGREVLGKPRQDVVKALQVLATEGWKIIVHTTRHPEDIIHHLQAYCVPFDEINKNSDYHNEGNKPVATVYWDDRALHYSGNAMDDLELIRTFRTWSGRE
jgi:adenylylsulfate kinase